VEFELFKLWQFMMQSKHSFDVSELTMSLWVNEADFKAKQNLYERSGDLMAVDTITVFIFDQRNGSTHVTNRFALTNDTDQVKNILLPHLPKALVDREDLTSDIMPGQTIEKGPISGLSEISHGLSND
jgi:hypothetical protein